MKSKLGIITMCAKAGKLSIGMDMMKDACRNANAKAVLAASDISQKSLKEAKFFCARYDVKLWALGMSMDELHAGLGKRAGLMAVCDSGFAKACVKGLEEINTDDMITD